MVLIGMVRGAEMTGAEAGIAAAVSTVILMTGDPSHTLGENLFALGCLITVSAALVHTFYDRPEKRKERFLLLITAIEGLCLAGVGVIL